MNSFYQTIAEQRTWLYALDIATRVTLQNIHQSLLDCKADDDPDGDWDDDWADDDPEKFGRHFDKHAKDFGAKNWNDYARKSQDFYRRAQTEKLPSVRTKAGWTKIYDPKTNSFGSYNPQGKTETFFKPTPPTYYERQIEKTVSGGGSIINPLQRHSLTQSPYDLEE